MMDNKKKISEITRVEFIRWYWLDVSCFQDEEPVLIRGKGRPIEEAIEAGKQFDEWLAAYLATKGK